MELNPSVNITNIKYDEALKTLFDKAHEELKTEISYLNILSQQYPAIQKSQDTIREWFHGHMGDLNYCETNTKKKNALSKPNAYALMVGLISDYHTHNKWEDVMKDFTNISFCEKTKRVFQVVELGEVDEQGYVCACGKTIHYLFTIETDKTNLKLVIGSSCIKKILIHNQVLTDKFQKAMKKKENAKKGFRPCELCDDYSIPKDAPTKHKVCKKCWLKNRELLNVMCGSCGRFSIPKADAKWKKLCYECYKHKRAYCNWN